MMRSSHQQITHLVTIMKQQMKRLERSTIQIERDALEMFASPELSITEISRKQFPRSILVQHLRDILARKSSVSTRMSR